MSKSYPEKYAIAIRDSTELFLMFMINRNAKGNVYVNFNEGSPNEGRHSSYHASGQLNHKSHNLMFFPPLKKQPPSLSFRDSESIITTSIRRGDGRAWNIQCEPSDYVEIMEIPDEIILPEFGYQLLFELVEPGKTPWISTYPYAKIIQQHKFIHSSPWIVASLYDMNTVETQPVPARTASSTCVGIIEEMGENYEKR